MKKHSQKRGRALSESKNADPAKRNKRLTTQTRKVLGKHYAAKYRVRSRP